MTASQTQAPSPISHNIRNCFCRLRARLSCVIQTGFVTIHRKYALPRVQERITEVSGGAQKKPGGRPSLSQEFLAVWYSLLTSRSYHTNEPMPARKNRMMGIRDSKDTALPAWSCSQTSKRSIEDFEEEVGVLFVDAHRRRETDGLAPQSAFAEKQSHFFGRLHHLRAFFLRRLFRLSIFHQLDPEQ